jgi:hypothetical protein
MVEPLHRLDPPPQALPESVDIDLSVGLPPHSPRELQMIEDWTGQSFEDLLGPDARQSDREMVMGWLTLRRLGYQPDWEAMRDILIRFVNVPNQEGGESSSASPPSASGTGSDPATSTS